MSTCSTCKILLQQLRPYSKLYRRWFSKTRYRPAGGDHLQRTITNTREEVLSRAEVAEIRELSSTVKLLRLRIHNSQFSFKAGQWVDMFIPGVDTVGGFSILSPPRLLKEEGVLNLAIKYARHPPALWAHTKCQVGHQVDLRVGGDFFYAPSPDCPPRDLLLIAGGVGVNPLFSMLQHFVHCQKELPGLRDSSASMLYSARNEQELIFSKDLQSLADNAHNVSLRLFSSRDKPMQPAAITSGKIQLGDVKAAVETMETSRTDVYLCGPLPFIETMQAHCIASNIPPTSVHYEKWC